MKALKKPLSLFLAFLMCFGVFAGTGVTAFAAGETMTTYMVDIPRASDPNKAGWGHSDMSFLGGWSAQANDSFSVHTQDAYNGKAIYCIEPGVGVKTGDQYTGRGEDFWDNYPSHLNPTIPPSTIKEYIGRIMTYGWQGNANTGCAPTKSTPLHTFCTAETPYLPMRWGRAKPMRWWRQRWR